VYVSYITLLCSSSILTLEIRIIAGNHDLTLDSEWYKENGSCWHRSGLEVGYDLLPFFLRLVNTVSDQDVDMVRGLLQPDGSFKYLEYSSAEIQTNGKDWKVYGSPVSPRFRSNRNTMKRSTGSARVRRLGFQL
jgi:hypothetical protein